MNSSYTTIEKALGSTGVTTRASPPDAGYRLHIIGRPSGGARRLGELGEVALGNVELRDGRPPCLRAEDVCEFTQAEAHELELELELELGAEHGDDLDASRQAVNE